MALNFETIDDIVSPLELTPEELKREDTVADFERLALECYRSKEAGPPDELSRILKAALSKYQELRVEDAVTFMRYEQVTSLLMAASLVGRPDAELQEFFTKRLLPVLPLEDVDLRSNLDLRFVYLGYTESGHRSERERIGRWMQENTERLGGAGLVAQNSSATPPPTLGNWLKDYEVFFPTFTVRGTFHRLRYLSEGDNPKRLSEQERALLLHGLELYDFVRFPSVAFKEMGRPWPKEEVVFEIPPAVSPTGFSAIKFLAAMEGKLTAAESQVQADTKGELSKLLKMFYDNLFPIPGASYKRALVLGALVVLAREGWLLRLLSEPNPVREQFVKYLREEGKPEEAPAFALTSTSPLSLGKFLRFVLVRRMRMPESDAAQIAVRIGNILKAAGKPEYWDMAYFDQGSGTFRWKT